tara:strand:- start:1552 stop:2388 length:837 start_codon:yes stop_codon:yes gene_type:complete
MGLTAEQYQRGERLACQTLPKSDLEIDLEVSLASQAPSVAVEGVIIAQHQRTPDIVVLEVELVSPMQFRPGQFAEVSIADANIMRSYSFANSPGERHIEFHVRLVPGGAFSGWLNAGSRCGEKLIVRGPLGQFGLHESARPIICIAGGTGFAPIKSILQSMREVSLQRRVIFMYGARTRDDLYSETDVDKWRQKWQAPFDFIPVLSAQPSGPEWRGLTGMVTEHLPSEVDSNWEAYLCGPPPMVDAAERALINQNVPFDQIFADRFFDQSTVKVAPDR